MTSTPLLVLGMHRSGTSCLAGCLEAGGLNLGDVNTSAPFNKNGNRESVVLMKLHDEVLAHAGASWDAPPRGAVEWPDAQLEQLRFHITQFASHPRWGAKDPRALFLLRGWRKVSRPRFVATFRHPLAVAGSLSGRAKAWGRDLSDDDALAIWLAYNRRLLEELESGQIPLIRYDQPAEAYRVRLAEICASFGLNADGAFSFYAGQLNHHAAAGATVPPAAHRVWEQLLEHEARRPTPR